MSKPEPYYPFKLSLSLGRDTGQVTFSCPLSRLPVTVAWNPGVLPGPFIFPLLSQGSLTPITSTQNHLLEPPCILSCSTQGWHTHPVPLLDLYTRDSISSQVVSLPSASLALTTWKHTGDPSALSTETSSPPPTSIFKGYLPPTLFLLL